MLNRSARAATGQDEKKSFILEIERSDKSDLDISNGTCCLMTVLLKKRMTQNGVHHYLSL